MEIIMQWLDDLDDLVFAAIVTVERLRLPCLEVGLAAACALVAVRLADVLVTSVPALIGVALGSVVIWAVSLAVPDLPRQARVAAGVPAAPDA